MIVITGGAGFIGSNLIGGLQDKGLNDLVVCDWLGKGDKWKNLAKRELRDIIKPENLFMYLNKHAGDIEAVFHMGAISSTTEKDADIIIESNFSLSRDLWKWCAEQEVRFIYASSAATYGDGSRGFKDFHTPEDLAQLRPLNPYGWSKHVFDRRISRIITDKSEKCPPQWAGLKFFNVYGPNEYHKGEQMSVVCKRYPEVIAGAAARLFKSYNPDYEDGGQLRDFVYVGDCVDVMLWLYDNPDINGLYNVGTGKARSFKALAEGVFAALNMEPKINYIEMPEELRDTYQYFTEADIGELRDAGYDKPFTEMEEGIAQYVQSFMATNDPYR